jgi:ceramide glucosyltransferase
MHPTSRVLLETLTAAATVGSLFFYALSALGLVSFLKLKRPPLTQLPPVSILKPLKGVDPEIWESFRSHCDQDYPDYELIFGVSDKGDPAIELVRKLQTEYPNHQIKLIVCQKILGTNVKVSNLAQMLPAARHEILLVNDSDIRVPHDYLRRIAPPLADMASSGPAGEGARATQAHATQVGLVTCLYRGIAGKTLGSRLEALGIATDFVPGVLSARVLEGGLRFALGSTMVFRKADLASIGGFDVLLDYLADDYELGRRISAQGKRVELSDVTVDTFLPAYSFRQFLDHQMRWWRTIRDARRGGYAGLLFTFGLPWAIATVLAARGAAWAWALFTATFAARLAVGLGTSMAVLNDRQPLRNIFLLPVRDLIAPLLWAAGLVGNRIHWRGDVFTLKDGRLVRVPRETVRP